MPRPFSVFGSTFRLDRAYKLIGPLGKGSYGVVCAAHDKEVGRKVAIKKLSTFKYCFLFPLRLFT